MATDSSDNSDPSEASGPLGRLADESKARSELAQRIYQEVRARGRWRPDVTYRCSLKRPCVLAYVLRTPHGLLVHCPRYRMSPEANAAHSSAAGRAKNTIDGNGRWKAWTFFLRQADGVTLNCGHVIDFIVANADVEEDIRAGRAKVTIPR